MPSTAPTIFAQVVRNWFSELPQRHNARWRFFNGFARQKSYDIDRYVFDRVKRFFFEGL